MRPAADGRSAHAVGDRAVRTLLDVYEAVTAQTGPLPPWTLVIEHAMLADAAQRERAVRGGFGITVQHAVLWNMGSEMLNTWGAERTSRVSPLDEWLALGASLAAALRLYTLGSAELNGEADRLGSITPGKLADLVAYPADPLAADPDDLAELTPAFTITGGRAVYDPGGMLGSEQGGSDAL